MKNKTTFWNFLKNNRIKIPIVQRDYAQGRSGKEYLRKSFLSDIKESLDNEKEMRIDFVYGSKEHGSLNPLDGQQRLTTLWLLHWYLSLMAGKLEDTRETLMKFTYETRISSREFCEKLCEPDNFKDFHGANIVGYISSCTWFYSSWKQDPTIQAMLRMLGGTKNNKKEKNYDGIEQVFSCYCNACFNNKKGVFGRYLNKLTDSCPIVFYYLSLNEFKLTDDLYIKMNARGEQLTSFENFKADLISYIKKQVEESLEPDNRDKWKELIDPQNGIPIKLDTDWTDMFWKNRSEGTGNGTMKNHIDEIFFAFMNRLFWNELFIAKNETGDYVLDIGEGDDNSTKENENISYKYFNDSDNPKDYDKKIAYNSFEVYQYYKGSIPYEFFYNMKTILDNYYDFNINKQFLFPVCQWDESFHFIPKYIEDNNKKNIEIINNCDERILEITTLNQIERIVFFAVCKYFREGKANRKSLERWMRVVWNLVSGEDENGRPQIRNTKAMRTAIEFIEKLESHNIYYSLSKMTIYGTSNFDERCKEEIEKAKQIIYNDSCYYCTLPCKVRCKMQQHTWEDIIIKAEKHSFFKGSIGFLFHNKDGIVNWSLFNTKWKYAQKFFDKEGVSNYYRKNSILLRSLLSSIKPINSSLWFGNGTRFWYFILHSKNYQEQVHKLLINEPSISNDCEDWIKDEILLSQLLNDNKETWHLLDNWNNHMVLTQYSNRINGRIQHPNQAIVLDSKRHDFLNCDDIHSEQIICNTKFFYGFDIFFNYKNHLFLWDKNDYVYLMENDTTKKSKGIYDSSWFFTQDIFKRILDFMIILFSN